MTVSESAICVPGLAGIDAIEFRERLGDNAVRFEEEAVPEDALGEIALATAIVLATAAAIRLLATYLDSRGDDKSVHEDIEVELPDGSRVHRTIEVGGERGERRARAVAEALEDAVKEVNDLAGG